MFFVRKAAHLKKMGGIGGECGFVVIFAIFFVTHDLTIVLQKKHKKKSTLFSGEPRQI